VAAPALAIPLASISAAAINVVCRIGMMPF
jgi:hypothetical protein